MENWMLCEEVGQRDDGEVRGSVCVSVRLTTSDFGPDDGEQSRGGESDETHCD